jgi:hypothetical protein
MLTLNDGPCKGTFMVKRAPVFLRAVIDGKGETDVLDQVEDMPKKDEKIYVYKRVGLENMCHIKMVKRSESGWYALADYWQIKDVDGEQFRDNSQWQMWTTITLAKLQIQELGNKIPCPVDSKECDRVFKACCSCPRNTTNVVSNKGDLR